MRSAFLLAIGLNGCAAEAELTAPPQPTFAPSRWEAEYRTGSRLPLPDRRVTASTQPVYQFDAKEWERERPPIGYQGPLKGGQ
jgi:hypothetical protein